MTADCMAPHTLIITIMSHSTVPVLVESFLPMLFIYGSTTRRQNLRFSHSHRGNSRKVSNHPVETVSSRSLTAVSRPQINPAGSRHSKSRLSPTISITSRRSPVWSYSKPDRTSNLRKKPSPVVRVRRKRRKDADFSKVSLTATSESFFVKKEK